MKQKIYHGSSLSVGEAISDILDSYLPHYSTKEALSASIDSKIHTASKPRTTNEIFLDETA